MLRFRLPAAHSNFWSLADQVLVSGSNFLCGILLARVLGLEAFGAYVIAQTYLLYANTFQSALVVSPMMTAVPAESSASKRRFLLRGFLGCTVLVLAVTLVLVQGLAFLLGYWLPAIGLGTLALPLVAAMLSFQLQDWSRRACYSESKTRQVFVSDCLAYGGQFIILILLAALGELSPSAAIYSMAVAFLVSLVVTLLMTRLWPNYNATLAVIRAQWRASKNFLVSWQLQWIASSGVILLGTGVVGPQAAGAIRAVQNLLGPVNVLFQWMDNVVPVHAAARLRDGGRAALSSFLWRLGVIGMLALGAFAGLLALIDEPLIVMLYGEDFRPFAVLVVFQAFYYLFGHAYRMASYFQRTLGETRKLAVASTWWACVAVLVALLLVGKFADRGIMLAMVIGEIAGLIYLLQGSRIDTHQATHCVIRRSDGSVMLLLPCANQKVLHAALAMYVPSRWTGRLYHWYLGRFLPLRIKFKWVELVTNIQDIYPHLDSVITQLTGPAHLGALVNPPGPRSKLTLKLLDDSAQVLGYARLAYGKEAIDFVRHETNVLDHLIRNLPQSHFPCVLQQFELNNPLAYCLVESSGPQALALPYLTGKHFEFLSHLFNGQTILWHEQVVQLQAELTAIFPKDQETALYYTACDALLRAPIERLPACIEHGDFAPWNIRRLANGDLFVFDWEYAKMSGVPWHDALHFCFQTTALVQRCSARKILNGMRHIFESSAAIKYSEKSSYSPTSRDYIIILYLLRMAVIDHHESGQIKSYAQILRHTLISFILVSFNYAVK